MPSSKALKISIIGSGNVASQFGKVLKENLVGLAGRNQKEVKKLCKNLNVKRLTYSEAIAESDVIVIAISDDAIPTLVKELKKIINSDLKTGTKLFVHTSGPVSIDVLKELGNAAVLYPLQSLNKDVDIDFSDVPLLIEASDKKSLTKISDIAHRMSDSVYRYNSEQRAVIHLSAVFANNFTNYLTTLAYSLLEKHRIKPAILLKLILQSGEKLKNNHPSEIQTGPAKRGDKNTMKKHLQLIKDDPDLREVYLLLSKGIAKKYA